jgi:flagellin
MKQLLTAINVIGVRTKFSGNSLLNVNPNAAVVANQVSLQVSNQTTDTISISSNAFKNIGGVFGNVAATGGNTTTAASAESTMAMSSPPPASVTAGTAVYKVDYTNGTFVAVGEVASVSGSNVILKQFTSTPANNVATAAVTWAANDTISFGGLTGGLLSYDAALTVSNLTLGQAVYSKTLVDTTASTASAAFNLASKAASTYITSLSTQRSLLGAYQNQIEYTVSNVNELSSNLSAARSNVQDTDYASETASLTKGQILQQAATAMLAQANQMPNVILSLLK